MDKEKLKELGLNVLKFMGKAAIVTAVIVISMKTGALLLTTGINMGAELHNGTSIN